MCKVNAGQEAYHEHPPVVFLGPDKVGVGARLRADRHLP